jgi:mono/diheme cytochrome c family protein
MRRRIKKEVGTRGAIAAFLCAALLGLLWLSAPFHQAARAQGAPQTAADKPAQKDDYQRSTEIYTYKTTASSGPQRGEELYYYKCWVCHNQFAKAAPQLKDLFKRPTFSNSDNPITEQSVAERIRNGGPGMPSFSATLKPADIADLLSYIKDGCCFDSENPPPNPRYRAKH